MDNYTSHQSIAASKLAKENKIIMYGLLPHASHIMQPLDVGVFSHLKIEWREAVRTHTQTEVVAKRNFARVFKTAWEKISTNQLIAIQGFRKSGLFPVDRSNIDATKLVTKDHVSSSMSCPDLASQRPDPPGSLSAPSLSTQRSPPQPPATTTTSQPPV